MTRPAQRILTTALAFAVFTLEGAMMPSSPLNLGNAGKMVLTKGASQNVKPGPLKVGVRSEEKPAKVTLEPGARELPFEFADGEISLTVPQVRIHEIIAITP